MHAAPLMIDAEAVRQAIGFDTLIPALREAFLNGAEVPLRHRHELGDGACMLLMPAWQGRTALGVKIVSVFPQNGTLGLNAVSSTYLLCDAATGRHLAVIDGNEITGLRTAAASALAADHLARAEAERLLILGAGHVAGLLAPAFAAVRPIRRVDVWNRNHGRAAKLAASLRQGGFDAQAVTDLETSARSADIISCATLSARPLIRGAWLREGTHLDLIGGFTPAMREADDDAMRLSRVFIDTEAALAEAGDLTQPIASGALQREAIQGTLVTLCAGTSPGRTGPKEITLFKSVGSALEDLAAACLVYAGTALSTR